MWDGYSCNVGSIIFQGDQGASAGLITYYLYDDEDGSWASVYGSNQPCAYKLGQSKGWVNGSDGSVQQLSPNMWTWMRDITERFRPRYWYVVAANCDTLISLPSYTLHFVNFGSELAVDEQGLFETNLTFFFVYIVLVSLHVWAHRIWSPVVSRLLSLSMVLEMASQLSCAIHWGVMRSNGRGVPFFEGLGRFLDVVAVILLWLMLALLSLGYQVSVETVSERSNVAGLALTAALPVAYLIMFIWYEVGADPASTNYVLDSLPGLIILLVQLAFAAWVFLRLKQTYEHEVSSEKKRYFKKVALCVFFSFLVLPFSMMLGHVVSPWVRKNTVFIVSALGQLLANALFVWLFWPSVALAFFTGGAASSNFRDDDGSSKCERARGVRGRRRWRWG